jgi:murein DD-endopeptidase MepM/ murein hydrolase activator NlpD
MQSALPVEQPLTRRERREREAAAAREALALAESMDQVDASRLESQAQAPAPAPVEQAPAQPKPTEQTLVAHVADGAAEFDVEVEVAAVSAAAASEVSNPSTAVIPVIESGDAPEQSVLGLPVTELRRERRDAEASARRIRAPRTTRIRAPRAAAAPATRAVVPAAERRPRRRGMRAVVAMGFAGALALATSVPALSLLSPSDVQALALASAAVETDAGQRVVVDGDVIASPTVEREDYQHQTIEEYAQAAGIRAEATFTNNPSGTIQWPFAVGVHIGDRFGYRNCAGCSVNHGGQDFNPGLGAEIQVIADGVVSNSTDAGGSLGVVTMVDHVIDGETVTSVYAHMQYNSRRFEKGDTVEVGDVLGTTGTTGMSTGPHLHFEIRLGGINGTKTDPLVWLYENTN